MDVGVIGKVVVSSSDGDGLDRVGVLSGAGETDDGYVITEGSGAVLRVDDQLGDVVETAAAGRQRSTETNTPFERTVTAKSERNEVNKKS